MQVIMLSKGFRAIWSFHCFVLLFNCFDYIVIVIEYLYSLQEFI